MQARLAVGMGGKKKQVVRFGSAMCVVAVAAALFALYFARLGSYPLVDPDEPVYGQVAKEMASGAGWLTPHYNGGMWFDKPPLFYWLSAASASVLGPTELACRLPSALLAVGLVSLVFALVSYDFGRRAGVLSALVMATCLQQIVLARASVTDMTLVFCTTAALYAYRRWVDNGLKWAVLCGIMTGLGMLAKGPVAPVTLGTAIVIHLWWTGRIRRLAGCDALVGIAAALVVGLPWYVAMYALHRDAFVQGFLVANNLTRFIKAEHADQTGRWYSYLLNVPILLVFFFPWSVFLVQSVRRNWRANDGARLAFVWFAVIFGFFSLSKTILVTYIFPLYPAAALFVGVMLDSASSRDLGACRSVRSGLWAALTMALLITVAAVACAHGKYPAAAGSVLVLGAILVAAAALAVVLLRRQHDASVGAWAIGGGMVAFALWLICGVMPHVVSSASARDLVKRIPRNTRAKLVEYSLERPSILFYLGRKPEAARDEASVTQALLGQAPVFVFCKRGDVAKVIPPGTVEWVRSGDLFVFANSAVASMKGSETR